MRHNLPAWEYFGADLAKGTMTKNQGETMSNDNIIRAIHCLKKSFEMA